MNSNKLFSFFIHGIKKICNFFSFLTDLENPVLAVSSGTPRKGDVLTITCIVDANPPIQVYKFYMGKDLLSTKSNGTKMITAAKENSGSYKCEVGDADNTKTSNSVNVSVQCK